MRVLFFSDCHIELRTASTRTPWCDIYPLDLGPCLIPFAGKVDLAILPGDIGTFRPRDGVTVYQYLEQAARYLQCPIVFVPGNHEYYRGFFEEDLAEAVATHIPDVTILDRGEAFFNTGDGREFRILGATLWTDYRVSGDVRYAKAAALNGINDHRLIGLRKHPWARWTPGDAEAEHHRSRQWLLERLAEPHNGPTIVATHHVPHSIARHPGYEMDHISAAFYSDCTDLIAAAADAGVGYWICGHHHWSLDVNALGPLHIVSAQPGYEGEETNWSGPGIISTSLGPVAS
jgi:predicted MPP superfamily phosphohydrolase